VIPAVESALESMVAAVPTGAAACFSGGIVVTAGDSGGLE